LAKQYDPAIRDCDEAIRLDPKNARFYSVRAQAHAGKGEWEKAHQDFKLGLELDSKDKFIYFMRGAVWYAQGKLDAAIADFTDAIRLDPQFSSAFYNRGTSWSQKGDLKKALADYTEAAKVDPKNVDAHYDRGVLLRMSGEWGEAIKAFNAVLGLNPKHVAALYGRAWVHATCPDERFRNGAAAVQDAEKACELDGWKDPADLDVLATAYAEVGKFEEAMKWGRKALKEYEASEPESSRTAQAREKLKWYAQKKPIRADAELPDLKHP
jgi:tetratricopeptide (TPR) repeat protein